MKKFKVFCEKLFEFLAQISSLVTIISVLLLCLYMTTRLRESYGFGLLFTCVSFFCAFCNFLEWKIRTTKFYRYSLLKLFIWTAIGVLMIIG